ncbi:exodeoxyribonuclease VII large subunit [Spiroplasma helicoides]|uniref:Exodeoxyribonuclease 7 large subunit n=1 Tax=Spiroplasma helicoides TaxID=216938 RepID=A0A1B3SKQ5_9MOLU|nr:exodeoxyribonuclease VII large subunit [Spiroplasma helicoides]AOG60519.1 exodeoxyribonuclease VII large subunit [Spiroplasma helicoides]
MNKNILKISELSDKIKNHLESTLNFKNISIKGEIANLTFNRSGHIYFSLKDNDSKVDCAIWKTNAYKFVNLNLSEGTEIIALGSISFYKPSGKITFTIVDIKIDGIGELALLYEKRYKELHEKGWFDKENKQPIPNKPNNIGIVTAATGAAVEDLISTMKRRYPLVNIYLFPALVQGESAAFDIANKIKKANNFKIKLDLLIVGRGGGSYEDLWCFNEMPVLEAIHNSIIPIISAVGHEPDNTLADYVADIRASTPTAAAELATPEKDNLIKALNSVQNDFVKVLLNKINILKNNLFNQTSLLKNNIIQKKDKVFNNYNNEVNNFVKNMKYKINYIRNFLINNKKDFQTILKNKIQNNKLVLTNEYEKLKLLNPIKPLEKGFTILKQNDKIIFNIKQIDKNINLNAQLIDGSIDLSVIKIKEEDE